MRKARVAKSAYPGAYPESSSEHGRSPHAHGLVSHQRHAGSRRGLLPSVSARRPGQEPPRLGPSALLLESASGEPAPTRGRPRGEAASTSRRWWPGTPRPPRRPKSPFTWPGYFSRTSPAYRRWWTWRRCARRWRRWAVTRTKSTPATPRTSSSTTRWWSTNSEAPPPSRPTRSSNSNATASATPFLRWGQEAFRNFRVVPPDTGICHQVNLEYLAQVVFKDGHSPLPGHAGGDGLAHHDGECAWAWWGGAWVASRPRRRCWASPSPCSSPRWWASGSPGQLPAGRHRDGLGAHRHPNAAQEGRGGEVRRVLRPGHRRALASGPRHHRQHGAGVRSHHRFLPGGRRDAELTCASPAARRPRWPWWRPTARSRASFTPPSAPEPVFSDTLVAGPGHRRAVPGRAEAAPGPRAVHGDARPVFQKSLAEMLDTAPAAGRRAAGRRKQEAPRQRPRWSGPRPRSTVQEHGCATTWATGRWSSPPSPPAPTPATPRCCSARDSLPRQAVERGLTTKPWVKTSLAPGSKVVMDYLRAAGRAALPRGARASTSWATAAPPASGTPGPCQSTLSTR